MALQSQLSNPTASPIGQFSMARNFANVPRRSIGCMPHAVRDDTIETVLDDVFLTLPKRNLGNSE
jgi:hypothetical protein